MYAKPCYLDTSKSQYYIHKVKNLLSCSQPIFIKHLTIRPKTQQKKMLRYLFFFFIFPWTYVLVLNNCASRIIAATYINYKCRHISWQVFFQFSNIFSWRHMKFDVFLGPSQMLNVITPQIAYCFQYIGPTKFLCWGFSRNTLIVSVVISDCMCWPDMLWQRHRSTCKMDLLCSAFIQIYLNWLKMVLHIYNTIANKYKKIYQE